MDKYFFLPFTIENGVAVRKSGLVFCAKLCKIMEDKCCSGCSGRSNIGLDDNPNRDPRGTIVSNTQDPLLFLLSYKFTTARRLWNDNHHRTP